ncbi:hypothetical protein F2Q70_00001361 [Brassica cretica]|uniref:Uncharacterized protein n=1 Tax=Brassica cretica TaxID=69181 RepID=A0A8S9IJQ0_BRACR|nr:hypothetical protein F2Q70_00001361 [Brassica cretica]
MRSELWIGDAARVLQPFSNHQTKKTKRQQRSLDEMAVTKLSGTPWERLDTQGVSDSLPCDDAEPAECRIYVKSIWILESPFSSPLEGLGFSG